MHFSGNAHSSTGWIDGLINEVYRLITLQGIVIDTLIFDFGGVLVDLQPEVSLRRFRELGIRDIDQMLNPYRQLGVFYDLEMGLVGRDKFVLRLNQHAGTALTDEAVNEAIKLFLKETPQYKFDYLDKLRKEYKIYILSNTNPYIMAYAHSPQFLPNTGRTLSDYVDKIYASCEMHAMKPDRAIYEQMIEDSALKPEQSLFIDDSTANLETASSLGLHTLLATNGVDWRADLENSLQQLQ